MRDYISIGSTPCDEECAQVGDSDYRSKAINECKRFIELIRKVNGPEPELSTAILLTKSFPHDFGTYYEVVVQFDDEDEIGLDYALFVEGNSPQRWDENEGSRKWVKALTQTEVKEILKKVYTVDADVVLDIALVDDFGNFYQVRFTTEEELISFVETKLDRNFREEV